jgi:hypothetical protein
MLLPSRSALNISSMIGVLCCGIKQNMEDNLGMTLPQQLNKTRVCSKKAH